MVRHVTALTIVLACAALSACQHTSTTPAVSRNGSGALSAAKSGDILRVRGLGLNGLDLTTAEVRAMPHRTVEVVGKQGDTLRYSGVLVEDILAKAGMSLEIRGPRLREYLLAEGTDGYRAVFALTELSSAFSDRVVIVADSVDGQPLPDSDGPFKIIVSDERRHSRWVRNLIALTLRTSDLQ